MHSRWRAAAAAAGTPGLGPHDLRKYVGTLIAESHGVDTASKVLGHASVQVTERHYVARAATGPDVTTLLGKLLPTHASPALDPPPRRRAGQQGED